MGCQTLHGQLVVSCILVAILQVFMLKTLKDLYGKDIIGNIIMLWNRCEVPPFKNILEEQEELQQCLDTYGL